MNARAQFTLALVLDAAGAGGALLVATRHWQTVVTPREGQFPDDVLGVTGRTVDAAPTAFALVALAAAVAVIATRGNVRRAIGGVVALAGVGTVWRAITAASAVSVERARGFVADAHPSVGATTATAQVTTHPVWAVLSAVCAMLVLVAGVLIAVRGGTWTAMSAKYEAPSAPDPDAERQRRERANVALWSALDRGDDPTERDPRDTT